MIYGALIGKKHTFKDFHMIPQNRLVFDMPAVKSLYTNLPGTDGSIDQTEALSNEVHYENRKAQFTFVVIEHRRRWASLYSEIANCMHGKYLKITLDEDPGWYYMGRVFLNKWISDKKSGTITMDIIADPYKYRITDTTEPWLWDPFCFPNDHVAYYKDVVIRGSKIITCLNTRKRVNPVILVSDIILFDLTVEYEGKTYELTEGANIIPGIWLKQGENKLTFKTGAEAKVSIKYREGSL